MTRQMMDVAPEKVATMAEYPHLQQALHGAGGGAWMREASLALGLAAQAHIHLDETTLIYSDVRDLMALQLTLRGALAHAGR